MYTLADTAACAGSIGLDYGGAHNDPLPKPKLHPQQGKSQHMSASHQGQIARQALTCCV